MSPRTLALALAALLAAAPAHAQSRADSLEARLGTARGGDRIPVLLDLMREHYAADPERTLRYGYQALALLAVHPDPEQRADALYFVSAAHYYGDRPDSSLVYAIRARDLAARAEASLLTERLDPTAVRDRLGQSERFAGHVHHDQGRYDEAEAAYRRALEVFERADDPVRLAETTNDLAILAKTRGDFPAAVAHHRQALASFQALGMERAEANALHGLGIVYSHMGRYDEALNAFFDVLTVRQRIGDKEEIAGALVNIGGVYGYLEDHARSLEHYDRARAIYEALGRKGRLAIALANTGEAHLKLGQYPRSRAAYAQARALAEEVGNRRLLAYIAEGEGRLHERQGALPEARVAFAAARETFEAIGDRRGLAMALLGLGRMEGGTAGLEATLRAVEIAREMDSHHLLRDGYAQLADLYAARGRFAEALDAHRQYKAAYDSLFNLQSQTTVARLQTEYRTREQEQQIALLEQTRRAQRLWVFGLLGGVALLGVISALSLNRVRLRQRELVALEKAHRAETEAAEARTHVLEAENDRKARELEAARRLQLSMLPKAVPVLPNVEVAAFMRTATEVGGDYYDFEVSEDGTLTVAIGDATGHGTQAGTLVAAVKGLFGTYAEEPDLARAIGSAARALRRMALPQLFMAFAMVRLRGRTLELTGAGMPPALLYRATSGRLERLPLKGLPLGAPADIPYRTESVGLQPGDAVVLMSDGLPELRDAEGREFGYGRAGDTLCASGPGNADAILRAFVAALEGWTNGHPLHDDVTLVVLKIRAGAPA
jgi:serine phosphatase RsbU (regulator of sigma subunit)